MEKSQSGLDLPAGATDHELHAWQFTASQDKLGAGEIATFRTEVIAPNPQATGLSITFVVPQP